MAEREELSTSFGAAASTYEAGRPGYPLEAVAWLLDPVRAAGPAPRVADVGAGTGKLTRVVRELGAQVVAIDPDAAMLDTLRSAVVGVPTFLGRAESLPLPDAALEAVVLGQAWHWVDVPAASAEVARVLRTGGVLGLIWNVRDDRDPWVRELAAVMHASAAEMLLAEGGPAVAEPFAERETRAWEWARTMSRAELIAMVSSRSHVITAPAEERARILAGVEALFDRRRGSAGAIELPYRTEAFRYIRP